MLGIGLYRILRKRLRLRYVTAAAATVIFLISYALMSGNGISTRRALGMCFFYLLADVTGYSYDMLNALGAVALVLLWENPFLVRYPGFLFSVLAVAAIAVAQNISAEWEKSRENEKKGKWQSQKEGLWISFCIQLFTLPLVAYSYYEIPVYAMAVNFFVLAVVRQLFGITVLGVVAGLFVPALGRVVLMPGGWILKSYRLLCEISVKLQGAQLITGKPSVARIFLYYMVLGIFLLFLYGGLRAKKRSRIKAVCRMAMLAVLGILLIFPGKKEFEINFLDVGQGEGIYLCTGGGAGIFFDGGSTDIKNVGQYRILPFLKAKGIKKISYWFVSHTDADHISGLEEVLASGYRVEHLFFAEAAKTERKTKELAALAKSWGTMVHYLKTGDVLRSGNAKISCLYPDAGDSGMEINDRCLVLQYEEGDVKAFFGGDISTEVENRIAESEEIKGSVSIFKADHHGSRFSNGEQLLNLLKPQICVASAGRKNRYGHPGQEAVERIEKSGSRFYNTALEGRIRIRVLDRKLVCESYLEKGT